MELTLNIDRTKYYQKPKSQKVIGGIRNRLGTKKAETIEAEELINIVQHGYSLCPAEMTGTDGSSWKSQQVIIADIDNDKKLIGEDRKPVKDEKGKIIKVPIDKPISSGEALKICANNNINPYFFYHTFSNSEKLEKYRIVLVLDKPITDSELAKDLTARFCHLFISNGEKAADTTMADDARLIFGGKDDCAFNICKEITPIENLMKLPPVLPDPKPDEGKKEKAEKATPAEVVKIKAKAKRNLQELEAMRKYDIDNFDLEGYVKQNFNVIGRREGSRICFNPCPICGHNDDFKIYNGSSFCCYGANAPKLKAGGTIIDFLMYEGFCDNRSRTQSEAMQKFADIMHYDSEEWRQAYKEDLYKRYIEDNKRIDEGYTQHSNKSDSEESSEEVLEVVSEEEQTISELNLENWFIDATGVYRLTEKLKPLYACYAPVYPFERLQNTENGQEKITLRFERDNRWRNITVDKTIVADNRKVVGLAKYGLPINSNISKNFVEFLAIAENLNRIPVKKSANHFGWVDGEFVPYSQSIIFDADGETNNIEKSLVPKGNLNEYIEFVQRIRKETKERFEVRLVFAASLASVLIKPLNMLPFIVNIWGNTGTGKTVSLKLGASIWADPTEGKFITDSDSTRVALAIRAGLLRNLPVMIDDFSKAKKRKDELSAIIYSLSSGKEKDRGNKDSGMKYNRTWQNCSITTNESPLTTADMQGGAINRVLDYEMCTGDIFRDPAEVLSEIDKNHGVFGESFIELVKELGINKIKDIRKDFEGKLLQINRSRNIENKQLQPLSVILTADYIATKYVFKDDLFLNPEELSMQLKSKDDISDGLRAYNDICDCVAANAARIAFNEVDLADPQNKIEKWGMKRDGYIHFFPLSFRSFMEQNGHDITVFCKWAKEDEHKVLKTLNGNLNSISINGKTHRVYSIELDKCFDFEKPDDSEEIPF